MLPFAYTVVSNSSAPAVMTALFGIVIGLFFTVVYAILWGMVFNKAGYPTWYCVLALIPGVGLILLVVFAILEWPVERELRELKERLGMIEPEPEPDMG